MWKHLFQKMTPRFDIVSESLYLESVLCDDNCLENHIRKGMEPTLNKVNVVAEKGTNIYDGLLAMSDEEGIQTAGLNGMPEVGQTYSGRATIIRGNYPNGANGSGASWSVSFGSGILQDMTIDGFYCVGMVLRMKLLVQVVIILLDVHLLEMVLQCSRLNLREMGGIRLHRTQAIRDGILVIRPLD